MQRCIWGASDLRLLIIFQALDWAARQDRHDQTRDVGRKPFQGVTVKVSKHQTKKQTPAFPILWRPMGVAAGGRHIAIFNRSYYEEVLRWCGLHPEFSDGPICWCARPSRKRLDHFIESAVRGISQLLKKTLPQENTAHSQVLLNGFSRGQRPETFLSGLRTPKKELEILPVADLKERGTTGTINPGFFVGPHIQDMLRATSTEVRAMVTVHSRPIKKWFMPKPCVADIITDAASGETTPEYPHLGA